MEVEWNSDSKNLQEVMSTMSTSEPGVQNPGLIHSARSPPMRSSLILGPHQSLGKFDMY